MTCINTTSKEYRRLEEVVGTSISKFKLHAFALDFYSRRLRLPKLHEIPGANSEEYFKKLLDIKTTKIGDEEYTYANPDKLKEFTNSSSLEEALPKLNNNFTDLIVSYAYDANGTPIVMHDGSMAIHIGHKPSKWTDFFDVSEFPSDSKYINTKNKNALWGLIKTLGTAFGIKVFYGTSEEIESKLKSLDNSSIPNDSHLSKGFILNGQIYINSDLADADTPLHEWMHLMFGGIKYLDPTLYYKLVSAADLLDEDTWNNLAKGYKGRTRSDINEEILVSEWAKYITGQKSIIKDLPVNIRMDLLGNIQLVLDRMLFGKLSAESINPLDLYTHSLASLQPILGSAMAVQRPLSSLNATIDAMIPEIAKNKKSLAKTAETHRILANKKEKLMAGIKTSDNITWKLTENCN